MGSHKTCSNATEAGGTEPSAQGDQVPLLDNSFFQERLGLKTPYVDNDWGDGKVGSSDVRYESDNLDFSLFGFDHFARAENGGARKLMDVHAMRMEAGGDGPVGMERSLLHSKTGAHLDNDGASFGSTFAAYQEAYSLNSANPNSDGDEHLRVGGSAGLGLELRTHWSDEDGDGRPEVGGGFDLGPVTLDYKTEDPVGAYFRYNPFTGPFMQHYETGERIREAQESHKVLTPVLDLLGAAE